MVLVRLPEEGVPSAGVVSDGEVDNTTEPEPVEDVTPVPPLATGRVPVTLVARLANVVEVVPVPPLAIGSVPETWLVRLTADNEPPSVRLPEVVTVPVSVRPCTVPVPLTEVTVPPELDDAIVIDPAPLVIVTLEPAVNVVRVKPDPLPISNAPFAGVVVKPVPPLATGSVPVTPVDRGSPVAFVSVAEVGVPRIGVTRVGLVDKTTLPLPVEVVTPVPPLATGSVPVTPVDRGKPVALVSVAEVGVPRIGVTRVGLVDSTLLPLPVEVVTPVPPLATGSVPVTPVVRGNPVKFVAVPDEGVPSAPPSCNNFVQTPPCAKYIAPSACEWATAP